MTDTEVARRARIRSILERLVVQREALAATASDPGLLAASTAAIAYWQRELVRPERATRQPA